MEPSTTQAPSHPRPVRVVTVDDQPLFREAARAIVALMPGFEVVGESADGESAIEVAQRVDPDIVILDVRMEGMDGIDTALRLKSDDATRVIVLVSSADVRSLAPLAESCGAAAIVRKDWLNPHMLRGLWVAHRAR